MYNMTKKIWALRSIKSRRIAAAALDFMPDAAFAIDLKGRIILWNKAIESLTGISKEAIIGKGDYSHGACFYGQPRPMLADLLLNPSPEWEKNYTSFTREGNTLRGETFAPQLHSGQGAYVWSKASLVHDRQGKIIGALQIVSDISFKVSQQTKLEALNLEFHAANQELAATNEQLTAIEEELRQQYEEVLSARDALENAHQQLAAIIENLPDAVFVIDNEKQVIAWNREMETLTGVKKHEVIGTSNYALAAYGAPRPMLIDYLGSSEEEIRDQYRSVFRRMEQQVLFNEGWQSRIYGGRGAYLSVMAASLLDEDGNIIGAIEILRDITSNHENEEALRQNEALLREITDHMRDIVVRLTLEGIIDYVSPSILHMSGYSPDFALGKHFSQFMHPDDIPRARAVFEALQGGADNASLDFMAIHADGDCKHVECLGSPIRDTHGAVSSVVYVIRDITERKQLENKLRHLGMHDHLTQAYNRAFFEEQLKALHQESNFPLVITTCDIDGLKLVNDTLGHAAGDLLLQTAVQTIRQQLRASDILARVGGDELAIISPRTSEAEVRRLSLSIRKAVADYNELHPELPLSISLGYAFAETITPLHQLFEAADNSMYREKLHRQQSTRSAVVQTLMRALEARDYITEGHGDRMQSLVVSLAMRLGLAERSIVDLKLLAQFHDIGKVGVSDNILFKPGKLTPEEQTEMRRHCEIGNRIAQASPDLLPIADWILKHHEWWNGNGYPLGLKGEDIPLECRILSIADAYDAMTNDRPYRKALSPQQAASELIRGAGSQFDPRLVKEFLSLIQLLA